MKLRATPGSGQEWLVWDENDLLVATFHGYKMGSDRPQRMAETFVEFWNKEAELDSLLEQLGSTAAMGEM